MHMATNLKRQYHTPNHSGEYLNVGVYSSLTVQLLFKMRSLIFTFVNAHDTGFYGKYMHLHWVSFKMHHYKVRGK